MKPDSYNIQYKGETVHGQNVILQLRCSYLIQLADGDDWVKYFVTLYHPELSDMQSMAS